MNSDLLFAKIEREFTWDEVLARVRSLFDENPDRSLLEGAITAALIDAFELGYYSAVHGSVPAGHA